MIRIAILILSILMFAQGASAASFDCAKAGTKVEKMICADPELSKLDEDLSAAYSKALKQSSDTSALKQQQRDWIKERNKCSEQPCLSESYNQRLADLVQNKHLTTIYPPDVSEFDVDCSNAQTNVEKIICEQSEDHFESLVAKRHKTMLNALKWALMRSDNKKEILDSQRKWQKEVRNACEDGLCLANAYAPRTGALEAAVARPGECYKLQPILDTEGKVKPIEPVCQVMEKNLNQFCNQPPMVCQLKVAPEYKQQITFPKWKSLDPEKNMALIEAFIRAPWVDRPIEESVWKKEKVNIEASLESKQISFSKSKLDLYNLGENKTSYRLDSGSCFFDNPQLDDKNKWDAPLTSSPVQILYDPEVVRNINNQYFVMMRSPLHEVFLYNNSVYDHFMFGSTGQNGGNTDNWFGVNRHTKKLFEGDKKASVVMENMCRFEYRPEQEVGK